MRIMLVGPPGSGKGTQSGKLNGLLGAAHLATGSILREVRAAGSELGQKVDEYLNRGRLVPDTMVLEIIREPIVKAIGGKGFILDGFPRTIEQAAMLDEMLTESKAPLDCVIELTLPDKMVERRLLGHRRCPACGVDYHLEWDRPKVEDTCDACGTKGLAFNSDDNAKAANLRLIAYKNYTLPMLKHYAKKGIVITVDGDQGSEDVFSDIRERLEIPTA